MMGIYSHIFNVYIIRITIHYKLATFPVINSKNINMRQTHILSKKYSSLHIFKYTISHTVLWVFFLIIQIKVPRIISKMSVF